MQTYGSAKISFISIIINVFSFKEFPLRTRRKFPIIAYSNDYLHLQCHILKILTVPIIVPLHDLKASSS